jgi:hypothetical protein
VNFVTVSHSLGSVQFHVAALKLAYDVTDITLHVGVWD